MSLSTFVRRLFYLNWEGVLSGNGLSDLYDLFEDFDDDQEVKYFGPKSFDAEGIDTTGIVADVNVEVYEGDKLLVVANGPANDIEAMGATVRCGLVVFEGRKRSSVTNVTVTRTVRGKVTTLFGASGASVPRITVQVPRGRKFTLINGMGTAVIGDIDSPVDVTATSSGDVETGRVTDAVLRTRSIGAITVLEASGVVRMLLTGAGCITIQSSKGISELRVNVKSDGSAVVDATADDAWLESTGSGNIVVERVKRMRRFDARGIGKIIVKRRG